MFERRGGGVTIDAYDHPVVDDMWIDPASGTSLTEEQELYGDPWVELAESMTSAELAEWFGSDSRDKVTVRPSLRERPALAEDADPWDGVDRVAPRPLPGVTDVAGPALAGALAQLDLASLSPAQLIEAMTGAERLARWAQGVQLAAVKSFADYAVITNEDALDHPLADLPGGRHTVETGFGTQREIDTFCSDGIGAALGTSFTAAQQLIEAAYFTDQVPIASALVAAGAVDLPRLKVLARELAPVGYAEPEDQALVESLLTEATELTPRKLQMRARTAVMEHRPDGENEAHEREVQNRSVWVNRKPSGMATFCAYLSADEAQLAYQALNAAALAAHDAVVDPATGGCVAEAKSFDNLRADALMTVMRQLQLEMLRPSDDPGKGLRGDAGTEPAPAPVAEGAAPTPQPGESAAASSRRADPARVMLHLYMQASTLAGCDNRPATLLGYGPLGADQARALAEDAALTRILTDPFTGEITAIDLAAYRVPKILKAAVQARDRTCVFPSCDVPAHDTQIDHVIPHAFARRLEKALAKGRTTFSNLQSLCIRHHYLKTHGGWTVQSTRGSRLEWISPTGHSYRRNAEWGPPPNFVRDHAPGVPVDEPRPPNVPAPPTACPF